MDLIGRCQRAGGRCEVPFEEFVILLKKGDAEINGIKNQGQEDGKFKTQCRLDKKKEGETHVLFFTVITDSPVNWEEV